MPAQTEYSTPAGWGTSPYSDLTLPSGSVIQAKRLDFDAIIAADLMDEFDKLSPAADENVIKPAKGKKPGDRPGKKPTKKQAAESAAAEQRAFFKSPEFKAIAGVMTRILPYIVVQPTVLPAVEKVGDKWVPIPNEDREDGKIYADSVPMPDQMHIFQWAMDGMNMEDLSGFREQSEQGVGAVEPVESASDPAV